jgi:hypothetical protein
MTPNDHDLRQLLSYQNFFKSHAEYFTFMQRDVRALKAGKTLVFALDAYDANTLFFPVEVCCETPSPHYDLTKATWNVFQRDTADYPNLKLAIGPLALLESILYLKKHAQGALDGPGLQAIRNLDAQSMLNDLLLAGAQIGSSAAIPWKALGAAIRRAWGEMSRAVGLVKSMDSPGGSGLHDLFAQVNQGRISFLGQLCADNDLTLDPDFFLAPAEGVDPKIGMRYLNKIRGQDSWQEVYNAIDMSRLLAAARLFPSFQTKNILSRITSNGQLTLNAWNYSWSGEAANWPARPAAVAGYLGRLVHRDSSNWKLMHEEMEEAQMAIRKIQRALDAIPQIQDCLDPKKRESIDKDQLIPVKETLMMDIVQWFTSHYPMWDPLNATHSDLAPGEGKRGLAISVPQLLEWRDAGERRKQIHDRIRQEAVDLMRDYEFLDFDDLPFHGPLDRAYVDLNKWLYGKH